MRAVIWATLLALSAPTFAAPSAVLAPRDIFDLEWASDPRLSPDGSRVAYVRNSMDIMRDRRHAEIWVVDFDLVNQLPAFRTQGGGRRQFPPASFLQQNRFHIGRIVRLVLVGAGDGRQHLRSTVNAHEAEQPA